MDQPKLAQIMELVSRSPLFAGCEPDGLARLCGGAMVERLPKGKILFLSGDAADHHFYIQSGWVKLFRETLDGDQAIVDVLPAGHMFGETAIFEENTYPYSAEIVEESTIIRLSLKALKKEIDDSNIMAMAMLKAMSRYRRQQSLELEHRTLQNAPQRIGCFLLRLFDQNTRGPLRINLPYDKTLLASRLGMQPETFSRALTKLKEETGIRIRGSSVEIDSIGQLVSFSCSACTSNFPCADK